MEIDQDTLVKLASDTAEFVQQSASRIDELEGELQRHKDLLSKNAGEPGEKVDLVKIAMDQGEVSKVVDGLVKIGFVTSGERDQVVGRYMENPSEVLDLAASFVLPLAGEGLDGGGQHIEKQASEPKPERGAASQRPDRSVTEILRSVSRETSDNR